RFTNGGHGEVSSETIYAAHDRALGSGAPITRSERGDPSGVLKTTSPDRIVEATYRVPFLHHAAIEPINATAQLRSGTLTVWTGEREPLAAKAVLAKLSGLGASRVTLKGMPIGGSFGRRSVNASHSMIHLAQVVDLAKRTSPHPLQMIWSREED